MRLIATLALVVAGAVLGGVVAIALAEPLGLTENATTTVIQRTSTRIETDPAPLPEGGQGTLPAAEIYRTRSAGVVTIYAELPGGATSQGSGFIADDDGNVLTNAHVITNVSTDGSTEAPVRGASRVFVEFTDGERVPARIVGWDLFADVGVLSVDPETHGVEPLPLGDSDQVVVGQPVAAIGSPFGNQNSLAVGVVSATGRSIPSLTSRYQVADAIQIDAPINRGNSGGPLLDAQGRVIGINAQIRSDSGTAEGVGFAIPINVAHRSLTQLVDNGKVAYAFIGVKTRDVTPGLASALGFTPERGALVAEVDPDTPAERAGLRGGTGDRELNGVTVPVGGDVIVQIAGRRVTDSDDVSRIVTYELLPGQRVPFVVYRDGKTRRTVQVTLGDRPAPNGS